MPTWQSDFVEVNDLRLHYTRTGGKKPPLVLAHGFSDDGLCWSPVARALEGEYDVIMVDARGHGRSDGPASGYDPVTLGHDLAGVIAALGLKRPAVLGHSMGAGTAMALASNHPELPGAILLEDPPSWWAASAADESAQAQRRAGMLAYIVELKRKTREELLAEEQTRSPGWSREELEPWADAKLRLSFNVLSRGLDPAPDWKAALPKITCPALLITGDPARGAIVTPEAATALQKLVPQLRVANIPNSGHSIRRDQFARYLDVVRGFLKEVQP
jgi:N-formylmaleamate deformylase